MKCLLESKVKNEYFCRRRCEFHESVLLRVPGLGSEPLHSSCLGAVRWKGKAG